MGMVEEIEDMDAVDPWIEDDPWSHSSRSTTSSGALVHPASKVREAQPVDTSSRALVPFAHGAREEEPDVREDTRGKSVPSNSSLQVWRNYV